MRLVLFIFLFTVKGLVSGYVGAIWLLDGLRILMILLA